MTIKIEFENVIIQNEKYYRLITIDGVLEYDKLPVEYVMSNGASCIYTDKCKNVVLQLSGHRGLHRLDVGRLFPAKSIEPLLKDIKSAGKRLTDINKKIKEVKKWEGKKWEVEI